MPPTFVMPIQAEAAILVTDPFRAARWGIEPGEEARFRMSSIYLEGDSAANPPIDLRPADGRPLDLRRRDSFVRKQAGA